MTPRGLPPIMGTSEVADYYGVSRILASKWARESPDWPEPYARLKAGTFWTTDDVIAWGKRHGRKRGSGPREAGGHTHDDRLRPRRRKAPV